MVQQQTIGNMTRAELEQMINQSVEQHIIALLGEEPESFLFDDDEPDTRTLDEVYESIDRNMWTPPPGAKSSLELLREDRER
ncbi:MAG: hypothetical protein IT324_14010 [Anaerolineae bacterium]|nr:hypothetical protein [Anaerolineae bacterium]